MSGERIVLRECAIDNRHTELIAIGVLKREYEHEQKGCCYA